MEELFDGPFFRGFSLWKFIVGGGGIGSRHRDILMKDTFKVLFVLWFFAPSNG